MKPTKDEPGLVQLHHQPLKNGSSEGDTIFCAQRNIYNHDEMFEFFEETKADFPLPEGYQWMACNQDSKYFILTHRESESQHIKIDC